MEDKKRQTNTFRYCESVLRQNFTFGKLSDDGAVPIVPLCMVDSMHQAASDIAAQFLKWVTEQKFTQVLDAGSNKVYVSEDGAEVFRSEAALFNKFEIETKLIVFK